MNRYENSMPRAAFSFAAVAITAAVLGLAVVVPAQVSGATETPHVAEARPASAQPTEVALSPARIEVIGVREENTAYRPVRKQQS